MPDKASLKTDVLAAVAETAETDNVTEDTPLIGDGRVLDSMKLVELCLNLEDKAADHGFEFDWTSDTAMSRSRSMFRTAGTLADEFLSQLEKSAA